MALYQDIMKVPGLSGRSYQRQKQYWNKLGLGSGYRGTYDQNIRLLNYLKKPNYGLQAAPAPAPKPAPTPAPNNIARDIASSLGPAPNVPTFEQALPFYKAWESLLPAATEAASAQIDPYLNRQTNQQMRQYAGQLASTGGGRFGQALGGYGAIGAEAQRNRKAMMTDYLNTQQQGFKGLFYDPSREAYNTAITQYQGKAPDLPEIPTWEDYQNMTNQNQSMLNTSPNNVFENPIRLAI